jgi:transcriptional regulator
MPLSNSTQNARPQIIADREVRLRNPKQSNLSRGRSGNRFGDLPQVVVRCFSSSFASFAGGTDASFVVGAHDRSDAVGAAKGVSAKCRVSCRVGLRRSRPSRAGSRRRSNGTASVLGIKADRFDHDIEFAGTVDFARDAMSHVGLHALSFAEIIELITRCVSRSCNKNNPAWRPPVASPQELCYPSVVFAQEICLTDSKIDLLQGTLDVMVLQTLAVLGTQHGYGIARRIEQVSGQEVLLNQGTIYASLVRLQQRGWIAAEWGVSDNNRRAKFYSITPSGNRQLADDMAYWQRLSKVMSRVLSIASEVQHDS